MHAYHRELECYYFLNEEFLTSYDTRFVFKGVFREDFQHKTCTQESFVRRKGDSKSEIPQKIVTMYQSTMVYLYGRYFEVVVNN